MQRAAVVGRDDRHRRDPELARRAEDAQRDLAAVRYEELANLPQPGKRKQRDRRRASRYGTASEVASATAPPTAAPPLCPGAHARLISANA